MRGSFQETAPSKTAENTVKHRYGSVGSVVANHRDGGESMVVVTTLLLGEFDRDHKTGVPGLSCSIVSDILRLAILIQYRLETDGQAITANTTLA